MPHHDDYVCAHCGHEDRYHDEDGYCMHQELDAPQGCDCDDFESVADAAERQGMQRAAEMANG